MYSIININNEDYKLEYSIEASLYSDCIESVTNLMVAISDADDIRNVVKEVSNFPKTTLILFYAGLMEHHGVDGDGKVATLADAKKLASQYIREHMKSGDGDWYSLMNVCMEQVGKDNFFDLIGLNELMEMGPTAETTEA